MKILATERETSLRKPEDYQTLLRSEAEKVLELYEAGIIREMYFTAMTHCAVLILECRDEAQAVEYLSHLPLVKAGLICFDITALEPYTGFSRLLS